MGTVHWGESGHPVKPALSVTEYWKPVIWRECDLPLNWTVSHGATLRGAFGDRERRERVVVTLVWAAISGLVTYARTASFAAGQFRERDYLIVRNKAEEMKRC